MDPGTSVLQDTPVLGLRIIIKRVVFLVYMIIFLFIAGNYKKKTIKKSILKNLGCQGSEVVFK